MVSEIEIPALLRSPDPLRAYVQVLRSLTGAKTVSLFQPATSDKAGNGILVHDNELPAFPEFATLKDAESFSRKIEAQLITATGAENPAFLQHFQGATADGWLIRVSTPRALPAFSHHVGPAIAALERARRKTDPPEAPSRKNSPIVWIGLRRGDEEMAGLSEELPRREDSKAWWRWALSLGTTLVWQGRQISTILLDPVSGLPGRSQFQATMSQDLDKARKRRRPLVLVLINPDDFVVINEQFGREAGDLVIHEIADRLRTSLRSTDFASRFGGAVFSVSLSETTLSEGKLVAEKLRPKLTEGSYLNGTVRLSFSIGLAVYDPVEMDEPVESPLELVRRADRALHLARELGGGHILAWQPDSALDKVGSLDRLTGIFTANVTKDYRNMLLLWDIMAIISASIDFDELAIRVVDRLYAAFKPDRVGLFELKKNGDPHLVKARVRHVAEEVSTPRLDLSETQRALFEKSRTLGRATEANLPAGSSSGSRFCCTVPLIAHENCLGFLYLDSPLGELTLDSADQIFLNGLAGQLAVAFDRARLATQEKIREERERERLHAKLNELRRALHQSKLLYCSPQMGKVLETVRLVAPTDATVLITGETGTGKEVLAHTVHEMSTRKTEPFVVVDCGTIAPSLFERELFGHEKGAYTDARQRVVGRLAEAHGGTVFLDEIGEVPLELQAKLLRFVQEKQLTPLGGTRARKVDVRLIGATNRDLKREVEAGRFREDLYYRLKVVVLVSPPLRERRDDILFLAEHFLKGFSAQYHKEVRSFSPEAEALLHKDAWPGNVRQLQNRILQAVILCEGDVIGARELGMGPPEPEVTAGETITAGGTGVALDNGSKNQSPASAAHNSGRSEHNLQVQAPSRSSGEVWTALGDALDREIETSMNGGTGAPGPLGRWLEEDLIVKAHAAASSVMSRGATLLGIPETTYRRKLRKATQQVEAGLSPRSPSWGIVRLLIADLFRDGDASEEDVLKRARTVLLARVVSLLPKNASGAALMGVTEPTYRSWLAKISPNP